MRYVLGYGIGSSTFSKQRKVGASFVPPTDLDISGRSYESWKIDAYLNYHAGIIDSYETEIEVLANYGDGIDIRGNENPTTSSLIARQILHDNYVKVDYNIGYDPNQ